MKQELDELVGYVNGEYGSVDWAPIVYQYRHLDFSALVALYNLAPVALITPLRDGMNLVAKEYVACKPDGQGVLILSDMAGAARELSEAILVNPNYRGEIAEALDEALKMPVSEQEKRMRPMQERLQAYDAKRWATNFLDTLESVRDRQALLSTKPLVDTARNDLVKSHAHSKRPLILLDYDGTLVPFASQPHLASPDEELLTIMRKLAEEPRNVVYIISGRDKGTLGTWFEGLPVRLIAEHGAWIREPKEDWRMLKPLASDWKEHLRPILQRYVDQVSGSLLEEKDYSIAWHYRRCDPELGLQRSKELIDDIIGFTANFDVQVLEGKKVVEIRNAGVNKGAAGLHCVDALNPDFILAMGDDQTDEDMFRALPSTATSIRVGNRFSHAKYNLESHVEVRRFLAALAGLEEKV
jgi:trehalose 6-phosphate synthase/phosphatase